MQKACMPILARFEKYQITYREIHKKGRKKTTNLSSCPFYFYQTDIYSLIFFDTDFDSLCRRSSAVTT